MGMEHLGVPGRLPSPPTQQGAGGAERCSTNSPPSPSVMQGYGEPQKRSVGRRGSSLASPMSQSRNQTQVLLVSLDLDPMALGFPGEAAAVWGEPGAAGTHELSWYEPLRSHGCFCMRGSAAGQDLS